MADMGIVVEVYKDSNPTTLVDYINARMEPAAMQELRNHGAGNFKISKSDPKILSNPSLLAYRNFVRIRVNGVVTGGFIIQTKRTVIVADGEKSAEFWEVSGEGLRAWTKDAAVYPFGGLAGGSKEVRYFNFASPVGGWYNPSQWSNAVLWQKWNNPSDPNYGWRATAPAEWPDAPNAYWVWDRGGTGPMPQGYVYFRYTFTTTDATSQQYSLFFAVDDQADVYVDGELLLTTAEHAWQETTRLDFDLTAGTHVIAFKAYNYRSDGPGSLIAAFFKVGDASSPTSAQLISYTGKTQGEWKVCGYPAQEPGWTVGDIMLTLLAEAQARGVRFASNITTTFSATQDSAGNSWDRVSRSFDVGASYSDVIASLEEMDCDFYLDPDTLQLSAWKKRGYDKSITGSATPTIILSPGNNLIAGDETGQADIANTLMLRTSEGWIESAPSDTASRTAYGRIETQMSTELTVAGATVLTDEVFRQKAMPEKSATFSIVAVPGMVPFVDFNVGDYISAPGEVPGVLETRRVMSISVTESSLNGSPIYAIEFDSIFKDRQDELEKWVSRSTHTSAIGGGFSNSTPTPNTVIQGNPQPVIRNIPDAPTGLTANTSSRWDANGSAVTDVSLTWNPVVSSGTVTISDVTSYEVWGNPQGSVPVLLATVYDTMAFFPSLESGKTWEYSVLAVSRTSGGGPLTPPLSVSLPLPNIPLGAPSAPQLSSSLGVVSITWDGLIAGVPAPNHYRYMVVQRKPATSGTYADVATFTSTAGLDSTATVGDAYLYRLVPVDSLGIRGEESDPTPITVSGVGTGDIDSTITDAITNAQNAADAAQASADGKNTIYYRTTQPSGGSYKNGDTWFDTDDGYKMYVFDGTAWIDSAFGNNAIASVDAGKVTTGFLNAARISANSIATNQLLIGSLANLLEDPGFEASALDTAWSPVHANASRVSTGVRNGSGALRMVASTSAYAGVLQKNAIQVEPGDEYLVAGWVRKEGASQVTGAIELSVAFGATESTTGTFAAVATSPALDTNYVQISGVWKVPDGVYFVRPRVVMRADTGNTNSYLIDDLFFQKRASGSLIVDGTITGVKLNAEEIWASTAWIDVLNTGVINTNMVTNDFGASINLDANGSITFLTGQQNATNNTVSNVTNAVSGLESNLADTNTAVGVAQGAANNANSAALSAQALANNAQATANATAQFYRFSSDVAIIGRIGDPTELRLQNSEIGIYQNGSKVTWWNAGQFFVNSMVATEAKIANHKIEKFGSIRTIFRKV